MVIILIQMQEESQMQRHEGTGISCDRQIPQSNPVAGVVRISSSVQRTLTYIASRRANNLADIGHLSDTGRNCHGLTSTTSLDLPPAYDDVIANSEMYKVIRTTDNVHI